MEDSFKGARKNFNIVALLLIILWYTEAEIDKASILGISSAIKDVSKVYIIIWSLCIFFLFRYIQMLSFQLNDRVCKEFCTMYGHIPSSGKRFRAFQQHAMKTTGDNAVAFASYRIEKEPFVHLFWLTNQYKVQQSKPHGSLMDVNFPLWKDPSFLKNLLNFTIVKPHFLNYFLPLLILISIISAARDTSWDGSLWRILSCSP